MKKKLYYLSLILLPLYLIFALPYSEIKLDYYYDRFLITPSINCLMSIIVGIIGAVLIFIIIKYYHMFNNYKVFKSILLGWIIILLIFFCISLYRLILIFNPYTLFFIVTLYLFMLFIKDNKKDSIE